MTDHYRFQPECEDCQYVRRWHDETCGRCAWYGPDEECRATAACHIMRRNGH